MRSRWMELALFAISLVFTIGGLTELVAGDGGGWYFLALGVAWLGIATYNWKRDGAVRKPESSTAEADN